MPNLSLALQSFQLALKKGEIFIRPGQFDTEIASTRITRQASPG